VFAERARLFLVDHERGKKVFVRCGTNEFFVGKSSKDGTFGAEVMLRESDLNQMARQAGAPFTAILRPGDPRIFSGAVFPLEAEGVSIISDIDDTIKITEVRDKQATLRNTFLREFQAVPGMAEFYQSLARSNGAAFHYISASPWQLYEPLAVLVASNGFPAGTFTLKEFRWKNRTFFSLFASPEKYKPGVIEPLLKQFPKRRFILIGDSGERDPEIYGALARKFPAQIIRIYIRDVTNETSGSERYQKAFRTIPRETWQIFRAPNELPLPTQPSSQLK
jgi:phosphatidate phosphatase APP1